MTRVYRFLAPPSSALRTALTRRYGAHGERLAWWAPEGAEVPSDTEAWLWALDLLPYITAPQAKRDDPAPGDLDEAGRCPCVECAVRRAVPASARAPRP